MKDNRYPTRLRSVFAASAVVAALLLALVLTATASAASQSVQIKNLAFNPASQTINTGDSIKWTNNDSVDHTVTFASGPDMPDSGHITPGQSFSFTFTKAGSYSYHCMIHPNMQGTVTVNAANASSQPGSLPKSGDPVDLIWILAVLGLAVIGAGALLVRRGAAERR
jgi:plastocyanin